MSNVPFSQSPVSLFSRHPDREKETMNTENNTALRRIQTPPI